MRTNRSARIAAFLLTTSLVACSSGSPAELLEQAQAAMQSGQIRTAEIHLKNLLQDEPDNVEARLLLGEVLVSLGDGIGAESNLRRAVDLGAAEAEVQLPMLRALAIQGKFEELIERHRIGPALADERELEALMLVAAGWRALGSPASAEAVYRDALEIDPGSAQVQAALAELLMATGRVPEARELIGRILSRDPRNTSALLLRGRLELAALRHDRAEATLREVLELEPRSTPTYFNALAQLVIAQLGQGKLDEAAVASDELLALNPRHPMARYLKANVEVNQGNQDAAERRLEELVADVPNLGDPNRLLGAINLDQGQLGQARMYLQAALSANADDRLARGLLAETYLRQGDIDAVRRLVAGVQADSATADSLLLALAGRASLQVGDAERAETLFDQSEQDIADDPQQAVRLGWIYAAAGELDRARRMLELGISDPGQADDALTYILATIRLQQGDAEGARQMAAQLVSRGENESWRQNLAGGIAFLANDMQMARAAFEAVLETEPENTSAMMNLARVALRSGQQSEAETYLRQVVEIEPEAPMARLALAELAISRGDLDSARNWIAPVPDSPQRALIDGQLAAADGRLEDAAAAFATAFDAAPSAALARGHYVAARRAGLAEPDVVLRRWVDANPDDIDAAFMLGGYELEIGDEDAAVRRFNAIIAVEPGHVGALNNLAWYYGQRGDDQALEMAERAYAAAPENPAIADTLGWLRLRSGDATGALPLLEQAAAGLPNQPEIAYHLAEALAETGEVERAAELLESALGAAAEDTPWRADAERRLALIRESR